jgi:hypothetical protein
MFTLIKQQGVQDFYLCRDGKWHPSAELNAAIRPVSFRNQTEAKKGWEKIGKPALVFMQEIYTRDKTLLQ